MGYEMRLEVQEDPKEFQIWFDDAFAVLEEEFKDLEIWDDLGECWTEKDHEIFDLKVPPGTFLLVFRKPNIMFEDKNPFSLLLYMLVEKLGPVKVHDDYDSWTLNFENLYDFSKLLKKREELLANLASRKDASIASVKDLFSSLKSSKEAADAIKNDIIKNHKINDVQTAVISGIASDIIEVKLPNAGDFYKNNSKEVESYRDGLASFCQNWQRSIVILELV